MSVDCTAFNFENVIPILVTKSRRDNLSFKTGFWFSILFLEVWSWNSFRVKVVGRLVVCIGVNQSCSDRFIEMALRLSMPSVVNELRVGSLTVWITGVYSSSTDSISCVPSKLEISFYMEMASWLYSSNAFSFGRQLDIVFLSLGHTWQHTS